METPHDTPFICPACGSKVPPRALACPECGADDQTGWNEDNRVYDGLDLPSPDFDYDAFLKSEFGEGIENRGRHLLWWIAGICVLIAVIAALIRATPA